MDYLAQSERDMQSLISRIAHNRNCRIQESDLPLKLLFLTFSDDPKFQKTV